MTQLIISFVQNNLGASKLNHLKALTTHLPNK
jgi:hypothetical protein